MNDNDLENQLRALTGALHRPDPTPAWKADILSRALREASVTPFKREPSTALADGRLGGCMDSDHRHEFLHATGRRAK